MSENRKGENGSFFGIFHSEETKAKLREKALNRTNLPQPGNEVEVLDLKTNQTTFCSGASSGRLRSDRIDTIQYVMQLKV